jgi:hypothetical protein
VVLKGDVADVDANPLGTVALFDFDGLDGSVFIFPRGPSEPSISVKMQHPAYEDGSLKVSNDGRFVAWVTGVDPFFLTVYDVTEAKSQDLTQVSHPGPVQWIGDELLVEDRFRVVTFRKGDSGFAPVKTVDDDPAIPSPPPEAVSDQLGESFVGKEVYPSRAAAEAAGEVVVPARPSDLAPLRVGKELFRGIGAHGTTGAAPFLIRLSDKRRLDLRTDACDPQSMAAAPGGAAFAILQGDGLIQVIDPQTLGVIAAYTLDLPWDQLARKIAYASADLLIVATTKGAVEFRMPATRR